MPLAMRCVAAAHVAPYIVNMERPGVELTPMFIVFSGFLNIDIYRPGVELTAHLRSAHP